MDPDDRDDLDKLIQAMRPKPAPPQRGRPRNGFFKARSYTEQYWKLRDDGMSPWLAIKEVAKKNRKTPEHISACRKEVEDSIGLDDRLDEMRIEAELRKAWER
jgi:hypothetical protein